MLNFDKFTVLSHPNNPKFDAIISNDDLTIICGAYYNEEENITGLVFGKGDFWKEVSKEELEEAIEFTKELFNAKDSQLCIELLVDKDQVNLSNHREEKAYMAELNLDLFRIHSGKGKSVSCVYMEESETNYDE